MKQFKVPKFNAQNVTKGLGARVDEISQATRPALLDLTVAPDFNDAGQPIAWLPTQKIIKRDAKRTYNLFGQEIQVTGTIYKLDKGGKEDTYFQPNMSSLKDMFESATSLCEMFEDMMYWVLQARTISAVAQGPTIDPNLQMFIGKPYLEALISDDEVQFSRVSLLQAMAGEKTIYAELLKMLSGGAQSIGIVPESAGGEAKIAQSSILKTFTNNGVTPKYNRNLTALGGKVVDRQSGLSFGAGLGKASAEAGAKALKCGLGIKK